MSINAGQVLEKFVFGSNLAGWFVSAKQDFKRMFLSTIDGPPWAFLRRGIVDLLPN